MKRTPYWIRRIHLMRADEYICSECGAVSEKLQSACPRCGAILEKVRYSPSWVDEAEMMSAIMDDDW